MIDFDTLSARVQRRFITVTKPSEAEVTVVFFEELVDAVNEELQALESRLSGKPCPDDIRDLAASMCRKEEK